jgi:hypothetical protein
MDKQKKGKAIPVTGHGGPHGCEMLRFPHLLGSHLTDGSEVLSLTCCGRPLPPRKIPGTTATKYAAVCGSYDVNKKFLPPPPKVYNDDSIYILVIEKNY